MKNGLILLMFYFVFTIIFELGCKKCEDFGEVHIIGLRNIFTYTDSSNLSNMDSVKYSDLRIQVQFKEQRIAIHSLSFTNQAYARKECFIPTLIKIDSLQLLENSKIHRFVLLDNLQFKEFSEDSTFSIKHKNGNPNNPEICYNNDASFRDTVRFILISFNNNVTDTLRSEELVLIP